MLSVLTNKMKQQQQNKQTTQKKITKEYKDSFAGGGYV